MSEPNDVAGHNHRYPPSRDDCPRCIKVREILKPSEPKIVAECWTCLKDGKPKVVIETENRHRAAGHDVRPVTQDKGGEK